jgi:ferredoxin-type protein NapG
MGKAKIDPALCYSLLFLEHDKVPDQSGARPAGLCNTCYNVCPLADKAIMLKDNLFPVILDGCVGCGICVERCPVRPKRAVKVIPTGMGRADEAGFHYQRAKKRHEITSGARRVDPSKPLKGEDLLKEKSEITGTEHAPKFTFPGEPPKTIEGWE